MGLDTLDALVIGYSDTPVREYGRSARMRGTDSPEYGIFQRDHVRMGQVPLSYLDLLNVLDSRAGGSVGFNISDMPSLAVLYLAGHLRRFGYRAEFVAGYRRQRDRLADLLREGRPAVVAITTTFYVTTDPVAEIVEFVRACCPTALVVVGGPLIVNLAADQAALNRNVKPFQRMGADAYVVDAQGEATLALVVAAVKNGGKLDAVPNLLTWDGHTGLLATQREPENNSLDEWQVPWHLLPVHRLGGAVPLRTARSCAFKCQFCDYPVRAGSLSLASLETVLGELDALAAAGVSDVVFIDDTFNVPLPRFRELCRGMLERKYSFRWWSYLRCSNIADPGTYELMAESGCAGVFLGIESGDDRMLVNMNKSASISRYRHGIKCLRDNDIETFASFIVGFPGESASTISRTISFINSTEPDYFRAEPWWYNHRSPVHLKADHYDLQGRDYHWRHKTMDSREASAQTQRIFEEVTGSMWMPMFNFDFWALPYLRSRGFTALQIKKFHELARKLMNANFQSGPQVVDLRRRVEQELMNWYQEVNAGRIAAGLYPGSAMM